MEYEMLLSILERHNIEIVEKNLAGRLKALYCDNTIFIDKKLNKTQKKCVLAEELGHHFKNFGDILSKKDINSIKQEKIGRSWGYELLIPYEKIISTKNDCESIYELAEKLNVTEEFLIEAIEYYQQKFGFAI